LDRDTIGRRFADSFAKWGERSAISFLRGGRLETSMSYRELDRDTNHMAGFLLDSGLERGDRAVLFLPKSLISVVATIALQRIGVVAVPLNPGFTRSEMAYLLSDAQASMVLAGSAGAELIRDIDPLTNVLETPEETPYQDVDFFRSAPEYRSPADLLPDDPGLIIYTSGTTGKPKGAVLTQRNLIHDADSIIGIWDISEEDVLCHALPLFHVHGLCFALHTSLLAGSHVVMLDAFAPETVIDALSKPLGGVAGSPCGLLMAVPSMYQKLLSELGDRKPDFGHLRLLTSGSAPLLPRDFERIRERFSREPVEREGMSETGMNFSNPVDGIRKAGSIGLPLPGVQVRIVDPDTLEDVASGHIGEIWLRSDAITPGYWQKPKETQQAFCRGWFRTGDLGRADDDGYYYLTDRIKHIIISGGENISPKEVESVINRCPGVAESAVVGIPDDQWGEKVVAAVVPEAGAGDPVEAVQSLCREHLHRWKIPKDILILDALPRNTMGKVLVEEVKAAFGGRDR